MTQTTRSRVRGISSPTAAGATTDTASNELSRVDSANSEGRRANLRAGSREGGSQDDSRFTRRQLLVGGGVAAAGAGGGWFLFFRGPSGAIGVADNYISAVRNNNWRSAGDPFHEDAPPMRTIDDTDGMSSYEDFLSEQEGGFNSDRSELDVAENLSPSVNSHEKFSHYPEWNQEVAANARITGPLSDNAGIVDEVKLIFTTLEVNASTCTATTVTNQAISLEIRLQCLLRQL